MNPKQWISARCRVLQASLTVQGLRIHPQCRRLRRLPLVGKTSWKRKGEPATGCAWEIPGQGSLASAVRGVARVRLSDYTAAAVYYKCLQGGQRNKTQTSRTRFLLIPGEACGWFLSLPSPLVLCLPRASCYFHRLCGINNAGSCLLWVLLNWEPTSCCTEAYQQRMWEAGTSATELGGFSPVPTWEVALCFSPSWKRSWLLGSSRSLQWRRVPASLEGSFRAPC